MVSTSTIENQENKKIHVLRCITDNCSTLAKSFDCFKRIQQRLEQGDSLVATLLTGGLTNDAFKVYLKNTPNEIVFAKISFPYALWNPAAHYDVNRTNNEFEMLQVFAEIAPNCAPLPYLCEPVDDTMVLVTEWCDNDEQLASQAVAGNLDARVCSALARSIAKLHCADFDPDFNTDIRKTMLSTFDTLHQKLETMYHSTDTSRATSFVQEMGLKECKTLVHTIQEQYENSRDCLVHSDLHVKNILVEKATYSNSDARFGSKGAFSVVDWEMSFVGPVGRDLGSFYPFLLCCALAHALNENWERASNLMKAIDLIWEEYSAGLREGGKSEEFINHAFRSTLAWCGRFMFLGYFSAGSHVDDFLIDPGDKEMLLDSVGVLGLRFMRWGFDPAYADIDAGQFCKLFKATAWAESAFIVSLKPNQGAKAVPSMGIAVNTLRRDSIGSLGNLLIGPSVVASRLA